MSKFPRILLLIESSRGSGRALLRGVADYANHHGPWSFYWEPGGLEGVWPRLKALDVEGIILRDVDKLGQVLRFGVPSIVVGHRRPEVSGLVNVVTDSAGIGRMAAEHLLGCGFKHFAYCGSRRVRVEDAPWSELREQAFSERIRQAGFVCHVYSSSGLATMSRQGERSKLVNWVRSLPKPVGLMACNDDRAQQVLEMCKLAQLSVPDAIGVVGVDNDEVVCGISNPPLSSVAVNFERAGYESAQALDHLMSKTGPVPARIVVRATHVVVRRSTDFVAAEDVYLARALRFIRDNARQKELRVEDVARAANLSRRALEKRFRWDVGHSILQEIRRVRTDHIARLLVETQLPVREIAESSGFLDIQHFARYFRSGKRMSPLTYRKTFCTVHANT